MNFFEMCSLYYKKKEVNVMGGNTLPTVVLTLVGADGINRVLHLDEHTIGVLKELCEREERLYPTVPHVSPELHFQVPVMGSIEESERWISGKKLLPFEWYVFEIMICFQRVGVKAFCEFKEPNCQGMVIMMVGNQTRSRLVGFHSADPYGVIYVLEDDGRRPAASKEYRVIRAITAVELLKNGAQGVSDALDLPRYKNRRLSKLYR